MKIIPDTNVLVRAITGDDPEQSKIAKTELADATSIAVTSSTLCELVWVLIRAYKLPATAVSAAIRRLIASDTVEADRPAVEAGLTLLEAGGDFADGVIAYQGRWLGGEVFLSFDRQAIRLIAAQGEAARLLA